MAEGAALQGSNDGSGSGVVRLRGRVELVQAMAHPGVHQHLKIDPGAHMARFVPERVTLETPGGPARTMWSVPCSRTRRG